MKYLTPTWSRLQDDIFNLAEKIQKSGQKFDVIVAIARGGLSISHILSDALRLPITTFTISTYKDFKQERTPKITLKLGNKLHNQKILLVDDVSDTGKTFIRGVKYLKTLGAEHIMTASVFTKPWTKFIPDFFIREVDSWIVFPFDMNETITEMKITMEKEGKTKKQIRRKLETIGIPRHYITLFFK